MTADLVIAALNMAIHKRNPESAIQIKAIHTPSASKDFALCAGIQDIGNMLRYGF